MKKFNLYIILLVFSINSYSSPMEFKLVGNGGNCIGCEWISAEGEIVNDTPDKLEMFLKNYGSKPRIVFNSGGGDLMAGLEMGKVLRKYNSHVSIGDTVEDTSVSSSYRKYHTTKEGYCLSSCAYAFLGGTERIVGSSNRLGFHQFYDSKAMSNFSSKQFDGQDMVIDQEITGYIVQYLELMDIDIRLYSLITQTHPKDMYNLSTYELNKYGINTENRPTTNWTLIAYDKGLVAEFKSQEHKTRTGRLYARRKNKHYFTVFIPSDYYGNIYPLYSSINDTFSTYKNLTLSIGKSKYKIIKHTSYLSKNRKKISLVFEVNRKTAKALAKSNSVFLWGTSNNGSQPGRASYGIFEIVGFSNISGDKRLPLIALKNGI